LLHRVPAEQGQITISPFPNIFFSSSKKTKKDFALFVTSSGFAIASTSGRLHSEFVRLLFLQAHRETDRFFTASGVLSAQSDRGFYHLHREAVSVQLKSKVGLDLAKAAALRITLNLDGSPIISRTHTHPSHSQTSRLLTSSLSLGVPVPRSTQCMRDT
jgi:hypothetical protein